MNRSSQLARWAIAAAVAFTLCIATAACGVGDPTAAVPTTAVAQDPSTSVVELPPARLSVCFDGSPSVDAASRLASIEALADLVAAWPTTAAVSPDGSSPGVAGLELRIRKVMGGDVPTGSAGAQVVHVQVPSIPAVNPDPVPGSDSWERENGERLAQLAARADATARAEAAVGDGATAIAEADYTASSSEVLGCLEAAARADTEALLLLVSDLNQQDNNGRPLSLSGVASLEGRQILIVEACGTTGVCGEQRAAWVELLDEAGAGTDFVAPEALPTTLDELLNPS